MMDNRWGLDDAYFKKELSRLARDAKNYAPDEMSRALERLKVISDFSHKNRFKGGTGAERNK